MNGFVNFSFGLVLRKIMIFVGMGGGVKIFFELKFVFSLVVHFIYLFIE